MIITVTMNPALDRTVYQEREVLDPGGKGINVSKVLKEYGVDSLVTGFSGGPSGRKLQELLQEWKISTDFIKIDGNIRTNVKIAMQDGTIKEQNETGPVITETEYLRLQKKLQHLAGPGDLVIMSGSLPKGIPVTAYKDLITQLRNQGSTVFLDTSGEALVCGIKAGPDYVKPNESECIHLMQELGFQHEEPLTEKSIEEFGHFLLDYGIQTVIVSRGEKGAVFITKNYSVSADAPCTVVRSTVGAGDALTAAYAMMRYQGKPDEETIRFAIAASVGAVTTEGTRPASLEKTKEIFHRTSLRYQ